MDAERGNLHHANLRSADLTSANLRGANWRGANWRDANWRDANLTDTNLTGAKLSWSSHALISEILWRVADTESRQMLAALVGRRTGWCWIDCWKDWQASAHPEYGWALAELAQWVQDGDDAPDFLRALAKED